MANSAERISPEQAHADLKSKPDALLVCAYEGDKPFENNHLEGAISLGEFQSQAGSLPRDQEIIFYCA